MSEPFKDVPISAPYCSDPTCVYCKELGECGEELQENRCGSKLGKSLLDTRDGISIPSRDLSRLTKQFCHPENTVIKTPDAFSRSMR